MKTFCRILEWDSQFFGRRIARIESECLRRESTDEILAWASKEQIDCLYFLSRPDDVESVAVAEELGFHLVDIRIELSWRLQEIPQSSITGVRRFQERDLPSLQRIASEIYTDTRFYYDQHFAPAQVAALYSEWLTKSCQTETVFVVSDQGSLSSDDACGFITCQFDHHGIGRIGLLGVGNQAKGKGHGHNLILAAQQYFQTTGAAEVCVVTQGRNIAAQRLYQAHGFRTRSVALWYHKWFE